MQTVTLEGTQELMKQRDVAVILATGDLGLVRASYSAGKPAYGVGPGNAPAFIERTANVAKAVRDIVTGKTFDNGLLWSSENSVVVDEPIADAAREELEVPRYLSQEAELAGAIAKTRAAIAPAEWDNEYSAGRSMTFGALTAHLVAVLDEGSTAEPKSSPSLAGRTRRSPLNRPGESGDSVV